MHIYNNNSGINMLKKNFIIQTLYDTKSQVQIQDNSIENVKYEYKFSLINYKYKFHWNKTLETVAEAHNKTYL